jgi:hypothetical protein
MGLALLRILYFDAIIQFADDTRGNQFKVLLIDKFRYVSSLDEINSIG